MNEDIQALPQERFVANSAAGGWRAWLPGPGRMRSAVQMNLHHAIDGDADLSESSGGTPAISMRQGLGLVFMAGLLAGLLPFIFDLMLSLEYGTSVPFAQVAAQWQSADQAMGEAFPPLSAWLDSVETLVGLEPVGPGWLAALLSSLGNWIDWPLRWLFSWIVYGLCVLVIAKLLGAPTTLQRFYAGVSYAYIPLLLLGLGPIPYVGMIFALVGFVWAVAVYVQAVRVVAGFDMLRALVSVVSPALIGLLAMTAMAAATAISTLRLFL